jgi:hypothetical protein
VDQRLNEELLIPDDVKQGITGYGSGDNTKTVSAGFVWMLGLAFFCNATPSIILRSISVRSVEQKQLVSNASNVKTIHVSFSTVTLFLQSSPPWVNLSRHLLVSRLTPHPGLKRMIELLVKNRFPLLIVPPNPSTRKNEMA